MTYSCKGEHKSVQNLTEPNCQSFSQFPHPEYGSPPPWNGKSVHPMLPAPHPDSISSCFPFPLFVSIFTLKAFPQQRTKLELSRKKSKLKLFQAPHLFIRAARIVAKGFHLQFPGFTTVLFMWSILSSFYLGQIFSRNSPSALVKCWWWPKISLNRERLSELGALLKKTTHWPTRCSNLCVAHRPVC